MAADSRNTAPAPAMGPTTFGEFSDLFGPVLARRWLGDFRNQLEVECDAPMTTADSLANIHHLGARAGLIGFETLYHACSKPVRIATVVQAALDRLRAAAVRIYPEIDRECAQLR